MGWLEGRLMPGTASVIAWSMSGRLCEKSPSYLRGACQGAMPPPGSFLPTDFLVVRLRELVMLEGRCVDQDEMKMLGRTSIISNGLVRESSISVSISAKASGLDGREKV